VHDSRPALIAAAGHSVASVLERDLEDNDDQPEEKVDRTRDQDQTT
jgi:hypothetical protein